MNVALRPLTGIELFSGTGMLGVGFARALARFGVSYRAVCHVEREAFAASVLATRMDAGDLDQAPIWSDVTTFNATAWRGRVDCVVAGFPCQDLSVAGRRAGLDGERSGLFYEVLRIASDCGSRFLFLENVAGIASATATVVDEAEGRLEERAAARVVGELADCGWHAEWLHLRASDVGTSHGRERWFCFAWHVADTARDERDGLDGEARSWRRVCETSDELGDAESDGRREGRAALPGWPGRSDLGGASGAVGYTECARWASSRDGLEIDTGSEPEPRCGNVGHADFAHVARGGGRQ